MSATAIDPRNLTQEPCPRKCSGKQVWVYGRRWPKGLRCSNAPRCSWTRSAKRKP